MGDYSYMKRYKLTQSSTLKGRRSILIESSDGQWVRYEDHMAELVSLIKEKTVCPTCANKGVISMHNSFGHVADEPCPDCGQEK